MNYYVRCDYHPHENLATELARPPPMLGVKFNSISQILNVILVVVVEASRSLELDVPGTVRTLRGHAPTNTSI